MGNAFGCMYVGIEKALRQEMAVDIDKRMLTSRSRPPVMAWYVLLEIAIHDCSRARRAGQRVSFSLPEPFLMYGIICKRSFGSSNGASEMSVVDTGDEQ